MRRTVSAKGDLPTHAYNAEAPASGNSVMMKMINDLILKYPMAHPEMMLETTMMAPVIMLYRMVWKGLRPNPCRMRAGCELCEL